MTASKNINTAVRARKLILEGSTIQCEPTWFGTTALKDYIEWKSHLDKYICNGVPSRNAVALDLMNRLFSAEVSINTLLTANDWVENVLSIQHLVSASYLTLKHIS